MQNLEFTALERIRVPRPVDRLTFIENKVRGKRVLDLGALDETAFKIKRGSENWLHARLCASASHVVGVDNSKLIPREGLETINGGMIVSGDIHDLDAVLEIYGRPDIVVAGELIEHLPDTLEFLRRLIANPSLRGVEFVFSTPNACCWHNAIIGLTGRESMHVDHLQIYSYKTLRTIFLRAGIRLEQLIPCYARFYEMIGASSGATRFALQMFQRGVNAMEFATPMLSAGWIGVAKL